jgi:hypothetical protein
VNLPVRHICLFLIVILGLLFNSITAQEAYDLFTPPVSGYRTMGTVVNGDTVPLVDIEPVYVVAEFQFKDRRHFEMWTRTKHNVKIVYPYAILAAAKLKEYDKALAKMDNEHMRDAFIKRCEEDLRNEFEDELKALTVSQGKILMKLIDRESGKTTYDVVKQMRGAFQAAMWQAVARLFGHNMKAEYDANVEDIMIERAVKLVEAGRF